MAPVSEWCRTRAEPPTAPYRRSHVRSGRPWCAPSAAPADRKGPFVRRRAPRASREPRRRHCRARSSRSKGRRPRPRPRSSRRDLRRAPPATRHRSEPPTVRSRERAPRSGSPASGPRSLCTPPASPDSPAPQRQFHLRAQSVQERRPRTAPRSSLQAEPVLATGNSAPQPVAVAFPSELEGPQPMGRTWARARVRSAQWQAEPDPPGPGLRDRPSQSVPPD